MIRSRLLPGLLALALAAPAAHAQMPAARAVPVTYPAGHADSGVHILTVLPDGSVGCDVASEAEAQAFRRADEVAGTVRLTPLPSLNRGGTGFRIQIRATDQLLARPAALLAFRRAAARWEQIITSDVTTVMDLDYGPTRFGPTPWAANILGSTNSAQTTVASAGAAEVRDAIVGRLTDPALISLVSAIPVPTPSTVGGETGTIPFNKLFAGLVTRQALGYAPAVTPSTADFGTVPNIGFNSAFAYDFNPRDGITGGQTDFEALAAHEIGHALGFVSAIGTATTLNARFTQWDLYRVRPDAVTPGESYTDGIGWEVTRRLLQPGPTLPAGQPGNHVMFVGDAEYELSTATGGREGGDTQQASHWRADEYRSGPNAYIGIMDPTLAAGVREDITAADIRALELFGFTVNRTPSTASAQLDIAGNTVNIDFMPLVARASLPSGGGTVGVTLSNTGGPDALTYDAAVVVDSVQTLGGTPTVTLASAPAGSVLPGQSAPLNLAVSGVPGGAVVYGRLSSRLNDVARGYIDVPFQITVGSPTVAVGTSVMVTSGQIGDVTLGLSNAGDAPLTYLRILEPAASDPATLRQPFEGEAVSAGGPAIEPANLPADAGTPARADATLTITGSTSMKLYDLAFLPTGEIAVVDGGVPALTTILIAAADLSAVTATYTSPESFGGQATGIAFNATTNSLWIAIQETGLLREVTLSGSSIVLTGRNVQTGTAPFGLDYSPELDAFFFGAVGSNAVYAMDTETRLLPGYPAAVTSRSTGSATLTPMPGLSFTEGLLEMTTSASRNVQSGMFGKTVAGSPTMILPAASYGIERSPTDPNGTFAFTSRTSGGTATLRTVDPADLPAGVGTRLEAREPIFSTALLAPGVTRTLMLRADARDLPQGTATDELIFLTNSADTRIARFPVTISVNAVAGEAGPGAALDAVALWPNPASGAARVRLTLSAPADVSVAVYNTLGQRVAVLADGAALATGTTDLPLDTASLAAGVYVVRVTAGASVTTQKLTVIR